MNVTSTFFITVHLLPKDLWFEHGGTKLASFPGRHLTSVRPWSTPRLGPVKAFTTTRNYLNEPHYTANPMRSLTITKCLKLLRKLNLLYSHAGLQIVHFFYL